MHIVITAAGSRGDVQPYVALGEGLVKAGHTIRMVTHQDFEELVKSHGIDYFSDGTNVKEIAQGRIMADRIEKANFLSVIKKMAGEAKGRATRFAEAGLDACRGADLVISGIGGLFSGYSLAEKFNIPFMQAYYIPLTPTRTFPSFLFPKLPIHLGAGFNRLSYGLVQQMIWQGFKAADTLARRQVLSLPPAPFMGPYKTELFNRLPILYGFSSKVIPKPDDWGGNIYITGYWQLEEKDYTPPDDLAHFMDSGSSPIYIGFGSMSSRDPEKTAGIVLDALKKTRQRAVVLSGWNGMQKHDLPENVFMVESVPFSWLFSRVAAVIHHGGAGTTASGLMEGVTSIIIPFFGDQFYWGQIVKKMQDGPDPIPRKRLTADKLSEAINEVLKNKEIQIKASKLGKELKKEDGVGKAISVVEGIKIDKLGN